jgi:hypothetical protein
VLRTAAHAAAIAEELRRRREPGPLKARARGHVADGVGLDVGVVDFASRQLERRIRAHMPRAAQVSVVLTDNRYTMISVRRDPRHGQYRLRIHHMFADCDPVIARALARYAADNEADASRQLGQFIDEHQGRVRARVARRVRLLTETRGKHFDLQDIFDELNRRYFAGAVDARITWGARAGRHRHRNSIKMGSYSVEDRLIRIHRTLDRPFVPRYFVEWIVYHEMLHQVVDAPLVGGRRRFHTPEFLAAEARFVHYQRARGWERANIERLLSC